MKNFERSSPTPNEELQRIDTSLRLIFNNLDEFISSLEGISTTDGNFINELMISKNRDEEGEIIDSHDHRDGLNNILKETASKIAEFTAEENWRALATNSDVQKIALKKWKENFVSQQEDYLSPETTADMIIEPLVNKLKKIKNLAAVLDDSPELSLATQPN